MSVLENLDNSIKEKFNLYHIAIKDMPTEITGLKRVKLGLDNTYRILEKLEVISPVHTVMDNLNLLSSLDIIKWIPFSRITEVIQCFHEKSWKQGEHLIREGSIGSDFYIVKEGIIEIYMDNNSNSFRKRIYTKDYFGESAIEGKNKRMANVKAITDCTCLVINANDFKWIFDID